jgi:hypothetical protein
MLIHVLVATFWWIPTQAVSKNIVPMPSYFIFADSPIKRAILEGFLPDVYFNKASTLSLEILSMSWLGEFTKNNNNHDAFRSSHGSIFKWSSMICIQRIQFERNSDERSSHPSSIEMNLQWKQIDIDQRVSEGELVIYSKEFKDKQSFHVSTA